MCGTTLEWSDRHGIIKSAVVVEDSTVDGHIREVGSVVHDLKHVAQPSLGSPLSQGGDFGCTQEFIVI